MNDVKVNELLTQMRAMSELARGGAVRGAAGAAGIEGGGFATVMKKALDGVNDAQQKATRLAQGFEAGSKTDLAEVMVALQKANISFQAMTQTRNKLVAAYQEIMGMQV